MMRSYTGFPIPNQMLAEKFIADRAEEVDSNYRMFVSPPARNRDGSLNRGCLNVIVGGFTARYPRGKGTTGNDLLREFYAACHAIIASRSLGSAGRDHQRRLSETALTLGRTGMQAILLFPADGTALVRPKIGSRSMQALEDRGFVSGTYYEFRNTYRPDIVFLTDTGRLARKLVEARTNREQREQAAKEAAEHDARVQNALSTIAAMDAESGDLARAIRLAREVL